MARTGGGAAPRAPGEAEIQLDLLRSELVAEVSARQASELETRRCQGALAQSEQRWHSLFDLSPVGIGLLDENRRYAATNAALCELLGRPSVEVVGHDDAEFTYLEEVSSPGLTDRPLDVGALGAVPTEKRYHRPDGSIRWAWVTITGVVGPGGQPWTLAHVQDVTDRKADEQVVLDSEANLSAVATVVKQIQSGADARQSIVDAALGLAGAAHASLLEHSRDVPGLLITASTDPSLRRLHIPLDETSAAARAFTSGQPYFLPSTADHPFASVRMLAIPGAVYVVPVWSADEVAGVISVDWAEKVPNLDDRRAGVVTLLADQAGVALRQDKLIADLEALALTDALTHLPNRRSWDQLLLLMLALARRRGSTITVALADLDHFKRFNDTRGHPAGDMLLKRFAVAGRSAIREGDSLCRWGGEEFAMALPDCSEGEAAGILDRVRRAVPGQQTCSIGYATWDGRESAAQLMARADRAMYAAKHRGRDRVVAALPVTSRDRRPHQPPAAAPEPAKSCPGG